MRLRTPTWTRPLVAVDSGWIAVCVGLWFTIVGSAYFVRAASGLPPARQALAFVLFVVFPLVAVGTGLYARYVDDELGWIITGWCVGGATTLVVVALWIHSSSVLGGRFLEILESVLITGNLGTALGAIMGVSRAQARRTVLLEERERAQREGMELVTHLLQHHVRNGMTIVRGYADELREAGNADQVEVIEAQTERIGELVENVETLVRALSDENDTKPIDLEAVVVGAVDTARDEYPNADITLESEPATVLADDLLGTVFENLLSNAVEHHEGENPSVHVSIADGDPVEVRVADDGPGVPEAVRESLSDPSADSVGSVGGELGLYLVWTLVTGYGGSIDLEPSASGGTVAILELPSA